MNTVGIVIFLHWTLDGKRSLLCSDQVRLNSRLVCFACCAVISRLLHNVGVQFFQISVFVCMFVVFFWSIIPQVLFFRMCSISLCIPVILNVVDVFCVAVSASLTSIQGSLKNNVTAHLMWNSIIWPQISPCNRQAYWQESQKSKYAVWFDLCVWRVLHWWKFITFW